MRLHIFSRYLLFSYITLQIRSVPHCERCEILRGCRFISLLSAYRRLPVIVCVSVECSRREPHAEVSAFGDCQELERLLD